MTTEVFDKCRAALQRQDEAEMMEALKELPAETFHLAIEELRSKGNAAFRRKDYKAAIDAYSQGLSGCADPKLFSNRSACLLKLGRTRDAIRDALLCIKVDPNWSKGYFRLGMAQLKAGHKKPAHDAFALGLKADPGNAELRRLVDKTRYIDVEVKDPEKFKEVQKALGLEGDNVKIHQPAQQATATASAGATSDEAAPSEPRVIPAQPCFQLRWIYDVRDRDDPIVKDLPLPVFDPTSTSQLGFSHFLHMQRDFEAAKQMSKLCDDSDWVRYEHESVLHFAAQPSSSPLATCRRFLCMGGGIGVGMLSAAKSRFQVTVVTTYNNLLNWRVLNSIAKDNNVLDCLETINCAPEAITVGDPSSDDEKAKASSQMKHRADAMLLNADIVDSTFIGKQVLPIVHYARKELLLSEAQIYPGKVAILAMLVEKMTGEVSGFDLSELNKFRWSPHSETWAFTSREKGSSWKQLSEPVKVFSFDFNERDEDGPVLPPLKGQSAADVRITAGGTANAVVFWFEAQLYENGPVTSNGPGSRAGGSMLQAIQWIDEAAVSESDTVRLMARHDECNFGFKLEEFTPTGGVSAFSATIPRWHFDMILDSQRNELFEGAIAAAISELRAGGRESVSVLDLGAGSGLLSMFAKRHGADTVFAIESSPHMAVTADRIFKKNNCEALVINTDIRRIGVGEEGPIKEKADILVMEMFDYGLLGEGVLPLVHHAWNHLLKEDAVVVPSKATVFAQLFSMRVGEVQGHNLRFWNTTRWRKDYEGVDIAGSSAVAMSEPFEVANFAFTREALLEPPKGEHIVKTVAVTRAGIVNCVAFWFEIPFGEGRLLSTAPGKNHHWLQAVNYVDEVKVAAGTSLPIIARHDSIGFRFNIQHQFMKPKEVPEGEASGEPPVLELCGEGIALEDFKSLRTGVPVVDPVLFEEQERFEEFQGKIQEFVGGSAEGRVEVANTALALSLYCNIGGELVDALQATQMAVSFFPIRTQETVVQPPQAGVPGMEGLEGLVPPQQE